MYTISFAVGMTSTRSSYRHACLAMNIFEHCHASIRNNGYRHALIVHLFVFLDGSVVLEPFFCQLHHDSLELFLCLPYQFINTSFK